MRETETDRERQRETERDRERQRETERETDRETERDKDRERDRDNEQWCKSTHLFPLDQEGMRPWALLGHRSLCPRPRGTSPTP